MASSAPRIAPREGIVEEVKAAIGDAFVEAKDAVGEVSITVRRESIADVIRTLRDRFEYQQLMEIAGVDYPARPERFEVVYHLLSVTKNHRIRVRVHTDEEKPVPSVTKIFPVAGWLEREVFDLYGVLFDGNDDLRRILTDYGFRGHPFRKDFPLTGYVEHLYGVLFDGNDDLRRILTDYGFRGHPFRKDFPLTGYVELRYSEEQKRVVYEPVRLAQDFRSFDFLSPWEGAEYILPGDEKVQGEAPGAPTPAAAGEKK